MLFSSLAHQRRLAPPQPTGGPSTPGGQLARAFYAATEIAEQSTKGSSGLHEAVSKDVKNLAEALKMPEWEGFFKSPVISAKDRTETLNELWASIGAAEVTRRFFGRLVEGKQTKYVKEMISAYTEILRAQKGEIEASVATAKPLSANETKQLKSIIAEEFRSENVVLTQVVDESLLAGLTLTVGSTYVDLSVRSQIDDISAEYSTMLNASRENAMQRKA